LADADIKDVASSFQKFLLL